MSMAPAFRLRLLGVGDLLDETINLYRRYFLLFISIGTMLLVPLGILQLLQQLLLLSGSWTAVGGLLIWGIANWLAYVSLLLATTYAVSEVYLGRRPTLRTSYVRGLNRLAAAIGLSLLSGLLLVLMSITLVGIPFAVYFGVCWLLSLQALLLEGLGIRRAMSRSRALVRGRWWRIVGIAILLGIIQSVIQMIFSLPGVFLTMLMFGDVSQSTSTLLYALNVLLSTAAQIVGGPIWLCGMVLLYYDLRVRKEGFDLELLAREIEGASRGEATLRWDPGE